MYFNLSFLIKHISCFGQRSELAVKIEVFPFVWLRLRVSKGYQERKRSRKLLCLPFTFSQMCMSSSAWYTVVSGCVQDPGQYQVLPEPQPCCCLLPGWHKRKVLLVVFTRATAQTPTMLCLHLALLPHLSLALLSGT